MAMNFDDMQARAKANTAKNHFEYAEGEQLVLLVPFEGGWENGRGGIPWVAHEILGGDDVFPLFKRPIMSTGQPYCETEGYQQAAEAVGKANVQDVADALVDSGKLDADQVDDSKQAVCSWAVCKIADRRRDTDTWSNAFEKTQVARFKRGNPAKPGPQRHIENLLSKGHGRAMMGDLSEYLEAVANGEQPEGPVYARLVVLGRTGKGQFGTTYNGRLASDSDGDEYVKYEIPQAVLNDIAAAVAPGGYANLATYSAESSVPSQAEIDAKVYGKGGGEKQASRPGMNEE